jgi:hypothetical protein
MLGLLAIASLPCVAEPADITRVNVGEPLKRFHLIESGAHRYLRYKVKDGKRSAVDIWSRVIRFEQQDGQHRLHILQRWDEVSSEPLSVVQDSWFELGTFRPLTHVRTVDRAGKLQIGGYRFAADKIVGLDDLPDNQRKDFSVASPEPAFNFEYDMEFLQALPLKSGYSASIPFYDPGREPPARYTFRVAGSDRLAAPDGRSIDCWVVTADYNTGKVISRFWLSKRTQVVLHEEQDQPDGSVLIKTLLNLESADRA